MSANSADKVVGTPPNRLRAETAVIGSGPGGAITACVLARAGRNVLLIEEGPYLSLDSCEPFSRQEMIEKYRNRWVLDCGTGSPTTGFYNVVHFELFGYPEVDVITDSHGLPFAAETFDAILSEAVLEHVRDPDAYTRELARTLKPGGLARLDVAFLQPYHGFPDHYFNMTRSGLQLLV